MTIKQVSEKYKISADTLRYYEKMGLIPNVPRTEGGIRNYDEKACDWAEFIICMRSAGLPVEALSKYVELWKQGNETAEERKEILVRYRVKLKEKIDALNLSLARLDYKIESYDTIMAETEKKLR